VSKRKTVTLRDLADRLGLSVYTVSKALRGLPGMSEPTRRLVFATARAMNYANPLSMRRASPAGSSC